MSTTPNCPRCGAPLASTASPKGLCAKCLLLAASEEVPGSDPRTSETGSASRPPSPAELAEHFPGLEILELAGQGGMGAVYKARQKGLERLVALKILRAEVASAPDFAERFAREARTLAALQHENLVTVHEFGQAGPWYYLVMELVDGVDLRHLMAERAVAPREALSIVAQVCDALQYAHDQGVVHRDIKPENILVDRRGRVRILDFGLSKLVGARAGAVLTRVDQVMGTPHYMAPEQWEKPQTVDHRADIYSLGVVFYELLTGELPIGRFEPPSHRRLALDVRLDDVVLRALERAPERRYQHASEVKSRVEEIGSSSAPLPAVHPASAKDSGRHRLIPHGVWLGAGCLGLLLVFALFVATLLAVWGVGSSIAPADGRPPAVGEGSAQPQQPTQPPSAPANH
jgi:serine/threonine protein kinase